MMLGVKKRADEEWWECVLRHAAKKRAGARALLRFEEQIAADAREDWAAWTALYEVGCLENIGPSA